METKNLIRKADGDDCILNQQRVVHEAATSDIKFNYVEQEKHNMLVLLHPLPL